METDIKEQTPAPTGILARWDRFLFSPSHQLGSEEQKRQARLLSRFLFSLMGLALLATLVALASGLVAPSPNPVLVTTGLASLMLAIAYILSRGVRYLAGAWIGLLTISALPYIAAITFAGHDPLPLALSLAWVGAVPVFGGVFLGVRGILGLTVANVAVMLLVGAFLPGQPPGWILVPLVFFLLISLLTIASVANRDSREAGQLEGLEERILHLETSRISLEESVELRTAELKKRLNQLRTAAEISRSVSPLPDPDPVLAEVLETIREGFGLYYVGLFLLDDTRSFADLRAGTGEAAEKMLAEGHRLAVGGASMVGWAISHKKPRISLDIGVDAVHFNNPSLPETRSEVALPLMAGENMIGALSLQSAEPQAFDDDDVTVLSGIASSLAAALHNAELLRQFHESLAEIKALHYGYLAEAWSGENISKGEYEYSREPSAEEATSGGFSTIALPLTLREQVIGELTLETARSDWSMEERALVEAITKQAAVAMENARLLEETRRRVEQERIITEIVGKLYGTADIDHILRTGLQELSLALNAAEGTIFFGENTEIQSERGSS